MSKSRQQTFLGGATILAAAVVIVKIIGAVYKIPLGNLLGSTGNTYFTIAYNIYNFLLTLSTAGLPLALSKLVSESHALGQYNQMRKTFRTALLAFLVIGAVGSFIMLAFPGPLAEAMHNSPAASAIRALGPAVICVCLMSAFRGYTQGQGIMLPTAVSQVIEALCKLFIGLSLAWALLSSGASLEAGAAGAISGVTVGTVASLIFLVFIVSRISKRNRKKLRSQDVPQERSVILKRILQIGVPITIGSSVMAIITLIDNSIALDRLQSALGYSELAAADLYGQYTFGMNLFNLPSSFIVPLTVSLIPSVSACVAKGEHKEANRIVSSALRVTGLLALPAGIGLSVLAAPILKLLYPLQPETAAAAAPMLSVLGIASIFVCVMLVTNSILQAHGKVRYPIYTMIVGGVVKVVVNYILIGQPEINIHGAPVGTLLCYAVIAILNLILVLRVVEKKPRYFAIFCRPLAAAVIMGLVATGAFRLLSGSLGSSIGVLAAILVGIIVYVILVVLLKAISRDDLSFLPKGEKIASILRLK